MSKKLSLSHLLKKGNFQKQKADDAYDEKLEGLQLKMLRAQQGIYHQQQRVIVVLEGFDAAGKGGAIRRLTEALDPRGFRVHPIGPPDKVEQAKHYLYRFWEKIPSPGTIAIFDRSWYGRVLVEKVEALTSPERIKQAYQEIREFEKTLTDDGIELIKIFVGISKAEQLQRFEDRLKDPYKQWKISMDDIEARQSWNEYVKATDKIFSETSTKNAPWELIAGNDKNYARLEILKIVTDKLAHHGHWMEEKSLQTKRQNLTKILRGMGVNKSI